MVKLIASDLDGTLLGPDAVLADRTIAALERASAAGVHVVAATGRGWRSASDVLEAAAPIRHAVCSNGALHYDRQRAEIVRVHPMERSAMARAARIVIERLEGVGIGWELEDGSFEWDDGFVAHHPGAGQRSHHEHVPSLPFDDPPLEVLKLLVSYPDHGEDELYQLLHPLLPDDVETTASGISFIEITGAGVHKAKGLQALCDDLGVDAADVVAFGDNRNDLAMIQWAGTGYAMANANPALLEVADEEAPHHAEHGVAQVIESLLS